MKNFAKFLKSRSLVFWLVVLVLAAFILITKAFNLEPERIANWFQQLSQSPFAIPGAISIYVLASFISVPQWALHAGVVLAFGPIYGSFVAWGATMVSASVNFWLGRRLGRSRVETFGGPLVQRFVDVVRKHGFWTSLAVRVVPSGPFIIVNMAAGVAGMTFLAFALGTALGIIPKIVTMAFFGGGLQGAVQGQHPIFIIMFMALAVLWMGIIFIAGSRLKQKTPELLPNEENDG